MTCIVYGAKTKKGLKESLDLGGVAIQIEDPSIFKPRYFTAADMAVGQSEVVTNHPKRSWFAKITRTASGWRVE